MYNFFTLEDFNTTVKCSRYRTAQVKSILFKIQRNTSEWRNFETKLAERADVCRDNHVVYTVTHQDGTELHFMCSDFTVYVGTKLVEGIW